MTNKEKFMDVNGHRGLDAPHALLKALQDAGATFDEIWELTEPHNQNLLRRALVALRSRKPSVPAREQFQEAVQPV